MVVPASNVGAAASSVGSAVVTAAAGAAGERERRSRRCCDECDSHAFHVTASSRVWCSPPLVTAKV